ncbi:precorrin-6y C5,15-methyltransferase (decarboxylating) subunit CbiE [Microlunatus capsulatus]|uniref:Precorrin-6Y C5,15-methyltransferase (Decarboxylating) n=1 Tax=Microlunatus capsulatus TaxID=99117 RepID=A0ABS4Z8N4_9ACTN|nr:precorrin-6y C5,15-methyltransferase (decarboxylating) subunit CbiE [Microlunatus capsulatus]MBP2417135.1 precorrin-6Y C5,15-methyltransferase (decarboxylating) [Microlunatus capsulatus]
MIEVVGIGAAGWDALGAAERALVLGADRVLGGPRHLDLLPDVAGQQRTAWPRDLRGALPGLVAGHEERSVVVLASGDPLLAGVGSTLVDLLGADAVRVHPAVSSVALAAARLGWAAGSYAVVRLRGDDVDLVRRELYPGRRVLVLARDAGTPAEVSALLVEDGYGDSTLTVLGDLGAPEETRADVVAAAWSGSGPALAVVAVQCAAGSAAMTASLAPGLPDTAYEHDGQLTKRDLRASALAHLQPRPGALLWDVGAGAGSVGVEWMRSHPTCRAVAVEQHEERAARVRRNAARLGVPGLTTVVGSAPDALVGLPAPDAVFVGGGGSAAVLDAVWAALRPGGRLVVHAVTQETEMLVAARWREHGGSLTRIAVEHLEAIGGFHGWKPARAVVQWGVVR